MGAVAIWVARFLRVWPALLLPCVTRSMEDWCAQQWLNTICVGRQRTWRNQLIKDALTIGLPLLVRNPPSFQMAECEWATRKAYWSQHMCWPIFLESVSMPEWVHLVQPFGKFFGGGTVPQGCTPKSLSHRPQGNVCQAHKLSCHPRRVWDEVMEEVDPVSLP